MNKTNWKEMEFNSIIDRIYKARAHTKEELELLDYSTSDTIPFVTRTELNNCVDGFAINNGLEGIEEGNAIIIGDTTMYQQLQDEEGIEVKYYPYNNICIYSDNTEFNKLQEAIFIYANENQYEMEVLYEDNVEDVIHEINANDFIDTAILLTKNAESEELFKVMIENKQVYVNDNPFKQEVGKIYNYLV